MNDNTALIVKNEIPALSVGPFRATRLGLVITGEPTYEEWLAFARAMIRVELCTQWNLGDVVNYGEAVWGEMYAQAFDETDYELGSISDVAWVCRKVDISRRRDLLSFSHHREVAPLEPDIQDYWLAKAVNERLSVRDLRKRIHNHHTMDVMGSSDSPEWYTPKHVINLTIALFGEIDLDPCSNSHKVPNVPAKTLYTKEDDGLSRMWHGRVYMNPPYGDEIPQWTEKLVGSYERGEVEEAIALLPGRIDTQWFQPMYDYLICNVRGRLQFVGSENSAPFPSVIVYLGERPDAFIETFKELGPIVKRIA